MQDERSDGDRRGDNGTLLEREPSLKRSKFLEPSLPRDQTNASWKVEVEASASCSQPETDRRDMLLLESSQVPDSRQGVLSFLDGTPENMADGGVEVTDNTKLAQAKASEESPNRSRPQSLLDVAEMDCLLKRLRTNTFAGEIDMNYHASYLAPPVLSPQIGDGARRAIRRTDETQQAIGESEAPHCDDSEQSSKALGN